MKLKTTSLLTASLIMLLFTQCIKDKSSPNGVCIPHENLTDMLDQPLFWTELPVRELAYFNPNNSAEIIYRSNNQQGPGFDLVKYNLETKNKQVLYTGAFANRPRWGKNGWILLNIQDELGYNVYKIKDNGEDLTALTQGTHCFNPEWNISSDTFIYRLGYTSPAQYILSDEYGNVVDTLFSGVSGGSSWQHEKFIASALSGGLVVSNPLGEGIYFSYETNGVAQSRNGAEWLDEERVFWCHTTGIYITNIITGETEVIRETCNAHCYQRPTYAPDIDKVIMEKLERILDSEDSGRTFINLVMMNPDGTEEEVIELK